MYIPDDGKLNSDTDSIDSIEHIDNPGGNKVSGLKVPHCLRRLERNNTQI